MKVRYDKEVDALYLKLSDEPVVESEMVRPGVVLDYNEKGELVGIEILNVTENLEVLKGFNDLAPRREPGRRTT